MLVAAVDSFGNDFLYFFFRGSLQGAGEVFVLNNLRHDVLKDNKHCTGQPMNMFNILITFLSVISPNDVEEFERSLNMTAISCQAKRVSEFALGLMGGLLDWRKGEK
jgi:hypothetical protein